MTKGSLAIIAARGGSKRIPKKNVRLFFGKPIISYSIKTALDSSCFDEVMVSTDDMVIADLALEFGARVPFMRSPENSDDFSTTFDVVQEVLLKYREKGMFFKYGCCIYPTAPLLSPEKLRKAFYLMRSKNATSVVSIVRFSFPPQRSLRFSDRRIEYWMPEHENKRSQDMEKLYHDAGQFYWFETNKLLRARSLISTGSLGFECNEAEVQDIDTLEDWEIAEIKYCKLSKIDGANGKTK